MSRGCKREGPEKRSFFHGLPLAGQGGEGNARQNEGAAQQGTAGDRFGEGQAAHRYAGDRLKHGEEGCRAGAQEEYDPYYPQESQSVCNSRKPPSLLDLSNGACSVMCPSVFRE